MDFWREQREAERRSRLLLVCFVVVVTLCVFAPYFIIHAAVVSYQVLARTPEGLPPPSEFIAPILDGWRFWRYPYFPFVAVVVLLPVVWGMAGFFIRLRRGGAAVAELLDAEALSQSTGDFLERRLLNVVEEIAIASGTPTPQVYLLPDEPGINAMTAGFSGNDAVICATRGAMELLTRDELQGVIAHEFSHILTGDMLTHTATLGLMHGFFISRQLRIRLDISSGVSGSLLRDMLFLVVQILAILLLLPLWLWLYDLVFGGIGKVVKAAFFKKREYLADANAARFTRYPAGLAGAMKKIAAIPAIQSIRTDNGDEANHLFFHEPLLSPLAFLVAAHPPVLKRIKKLLPEFDGKIDDIDVPALKKEIRELRDEIREPIAPDDLVESGITPAIPFPRKSRAAAIVAMLGSGDLESSKAALAGLEQTRKRLTSSDMSLESATAYVFSLLLDDREGDIRARQLQDIETAYNAVFAAEVAAVQKKRAKDSPVERILRLERAVSVLRGLKPIEYDRLVTTCRSLVLADDIITLLEYSITAFLKRRLNHYFGMDEQHPMPRRTLRGATREAALLLSVMSWAGAETAKDAEQAFEAGRAELPATTAAAISLDSLNPFDPDEMTRAVSAMASLRADEKSALLNACVAAVGADDFVSETEWEILKLFTLMLGCPLPPLPPMGVMGVMGTMR